MRTIRILLTTAGLSLAAAQLQAHHSFSAEFDAGKPLKLQGVVTEWELINPHSWIHIDVKGADGKVVNWMVEGGSPNALLRNGFNKNSLEPGTEIVIEGFQAKDGTSRAVGAKLTFTDGRKLFLGGNVPGGNPDSPENKTDGQK